MGRSPRKLKRTSLVTGNDRPFLIAHFSSFSSILWTKWQNPAEVFFFFKFFSRENLIICKWVDYLFKFPNFKLFNKIEQLKWIDLKLNMKFRWKLKYFLWTGRASQVNSGPSARPLRGCDWYLDGPTADWQPIFIRWSINLIVKRTSSRFSASFHWWQERKFPAAPPAPYRCDEMCAVAVKCSPVDWILYILHFCSFVIINWNI